MRQTTCILLRLKCQCVAYTAQWNTLGSISAAPSGPALLPEKRQLDAWITDLVCDVIWNFNLCVLRSLLAFWLLRFSGCLRWTRHLLQRTEETELGLPWAKPEEKSHSRWTLHWFHEIKNNWCGLKNKRLSRTCRLNYEYIFTTDQLLDHFLTVWISNYELKRLQNFIISCFEGRHVSTLSNLCKIRACKKMCRRHTDWLKLTIVSSRVQPSFRGVCVCVCRRGGGWVSYSSTQYSFMHAGRLLPKVHLLDQINTLS